jgi:hypothetical protein
MGYPAPIGAFVTVVSAGAWIALLIAIGAVALNYWAMRRIIAQAGYSPLWILLPLAPLVLTIISFFVLWHDIDAIAFGGSIGFFGIDSIGFIWHLDQLSVVVNWAFFIVFAFSRWPVSEGRPTPSTGRLPETFRGTLGGSVPNTGVSPEPLVVSRGMPQSAAGPAAEPTAQPDAPANVPAAKRPGVKFCAWCGEPLPGNRALFHDCGPKDRPATFCKNCGTALPAGASQCNACGAA